MPVGGIGAWETWEICLACPACAAGRAPSESPESAARLNSPFMCSRRFMVSDYTGSGGPGMLKITFALMSGVILLSSSPTPQVSSAVRADLAPTGTLRAGINYGNPILAQGSPATGDLRGIAVDLAREIARRIGVPVTLVPFDAAGKMTDALKTGAWDVAFLAVDPARASEISFTAPYLEIEGTYLVPAGSPLRPVEDVAREGKGAYDLFLGRTLQHAKIVRASSIPASIDLFTSDKLEAVAGVRQALVTAA